MRLTRSADINQFLQRRQPQWRRLEALLERVEATGLLALSPPEIREFGILYRRASSDLVSARSKTANAEVLEYLNDLVARAYGQVYRTRRHTAREIGTFLVAGFPRLFRQCFAYFALATALSLAAAAFGYVAGRRDPSAAYYLLPPEMARNLPVARGELRKSPGKVIDFNQMATLSGMIFTHNIEVACMAFAAGISLGIGTLVVLLVNGLLLGVFAAALSGPGTTVAFWSLILPHGIIELTAIFIAGAAGLMIGSALLVPGQRSRRDALLERGRDAVLLLLGTVPMFVCAGLIEGFITPPAWIPPEVKLLFAGCTAVALVLYLGFGGRPRGSMPWVLLRHR